MTTEAFSGGLGLKRGDGAEPEVFADVSEIFNCSGLTETNPTYDATHWKSTAKESIAGLAEGAEVTMEFNRIIDDTSQAALIADVKAKLNRNFELSMNDGTQTETFTFTLSMTSWSIAPQNEDRHTLTITGKISGSITSAVA